MLEVHEILLRKWPLVVGYSVFAHRLLDQEFKFFSTYLPSAKHSNTHAYPLR